MREASRNISEEQHTENFETEYEYKDGALIRLTQFFPNGKKKYEVVMTDSSSNYLGVEEIEVSEYYESGLPKMISFSLADSILLEQRWYENGAPELEFSRRSGKHDRGVRYFLNGKKKEEFEFRNEQRHGVWAEWDSSGKQFRNDVYAYGKAIKKGL